jgi:hypothetical protein
MYVPKLTPTPTPERLKDANWYTAPSHTHRMPNTTYKSARIVSEQYNLFYAVWCNNDHELYDLKVYILFFDSFLPP